MAKTTYTATLPNGEVLTRKTERTYTHVVVVERRYASGKISFIFPEWAGRPDLAQKNAAKRERIEQSWLGAKASDGGNLVESFTVHVVPAVS